MRAALAWFLAQVLAVMALGALVFLALVYVGVRLTAGLPG